MNVSQETSQIELSRASLSLSIHSTDGSFFFLLKISMPRLTFYQEAARQIWPITCESYDQLAIARSYSVCHFGDLGAVAMDRRVGPASTSPSSFFSTTAAVSSSPFSVAKDDSEGPSRSSRTRKDAWSTMTGTPTESAARRLAMAPAAARLTERVGMLRGSVIQTATNLITAELRGNRMLKSVNPAFLGMVLSCPENCKGLPLMQLCKC
uniref:Uncharacterized protein n=1 Tax=Oryza brachyantha TaxID=4533 RepID=J3N4Y7_ORYBR